MKMIIISYINILAMLIKFVPLHSMKTKETKTLSVFSLELQKINRLTCGPMTFIDFSGDGVDVDVSLYPLARGGVSLPQVGVSSLLVPWVDSSIFVGLWPYGQHGRHC